MTKRNADIADVAYLEFYVTQKVSQGKRVEEWNKNIFWNIYGIVQGYIQSD